MYQSVKNREYKGRKIGVPVHLKFQTKISVMDDACTYHLSFGSFNIWHHALQITAWWASSVRYPHIEMLLFHDNFWRTDVTPLSWRK